MPQDRVYEGRVMVLFAHGKGYALAYQATDAVHDFVLMAGGSIQEFNLSAVAVYAVQPDGLYVGTLQLTEGGLIADDLRPATEAEWANHCAGEWPWYAPSPQGDPQES
jgi:hypothetical protein